MNPLKHELLTQSLEIAENFRKGLSIDAQQALPTLVKDLIAQLEYLPVQSAPLFLTLITSIRQCQDRRDWLGLADYLEYELVDLLHHLGLH